MEENRRKAGAGTTRVENILRLRTERAVIVTKRSRSHGERQRLQDIDAELKSLGKLPRRK